MNPWIGTNGVAARAKMDTKTILSHTAHRPFPISSRPWIMFQRWHDLLFAHWPMEAEALRPLLPAALRPYLDIHSGKAWVGVIPFWMSGVTGRWMPPIPGFSKFPELNVRTYVTLQEKPGVYFFSLDADSLSAVYGARIFYRLPYYYAKMKAHVANDGVDYSSARVMKPRPAEFKACYRGLGKPFQPLPGTLEHFLTERYCLYTANGNDVWRGNIHHPSWALEKARAEIQVNSMAAAKGIAVPQQVPLLHFSKVQEVLIWAPERCGL